MKLALILRIGVAAAGPIRRHDAACEDGAFFVRRNSYPSRNGTSPTRNAASGYGSGVSAIDKPVHSSHIFSHITESWIQCNRSANGSEENL